MRAARFTTASPRPASIGAVSSSSMRTICWSCATMRNFTVVGRPAAIEMCAQSMPRWVSIPRNSAPASSWPVTPNRVTRAPSAATLHAVLAAPPGTPNALIFRTMGTGASGEMRSTSPDQ
jgi:hypothetical protein